MSRTHLLAAVSFFGLVASTAAFADSNTVNLNQTHDYNIAYGTQEYGSVGNALNVTQTGNQYANTYQTGSSNTINSNQSSAFNFLGAPDSYTAHVQNAAAPIPVPSQFATVSFTAGEVNHALQQLGVPFAVSTGAFSQGGDHNTLNNTQSGVAGLVQGKQNGSYSQITSTQTGLGNGLSVDQGGGTNNSITSYQGGFEIAAIRQNGSYNTVGGTQLTNGYSSFNSATVSQDGNFHQAYYSQSGTGNSITVAQTGTGNYSNLTQVGNNNVAGITQH